MILFLFECHLKDKYSIVGTLIDNGADVNATNKLGNTALHKAASSGN